MKVPAVSKQDAPARPAPVLAERLAADGKRLPPTGSALPASPPPPPAPSIEQAVRQIEDYLASSSRRLHFQIDEATGRTIIRVTNPQTGELIRQIPSEEVLRISATMKAGGFHMISEII